MKASVIGASGYIGSELVKILAQHPRIEMGALTAETHAGMKVSKVHPHLDGVVDARFTRGMSGALDSDLVFVCTPYGAGMKVVPELLDAGVKVVDLSGDYRLKDPEVYRRWYGSQHTDVENLQRAVYGIPELFASGIRSADLVANPGCYPTSAILALAPLVSHGVIASEVIIDAKSGTSGAGARATPFTHHPSVAMNVHPYSIGGHRHTPEIAGALSSLNGRSGVDVVFTPHLVPLVRGILCTSYAKLLNGTSHQEVLAIFEEVYAGKRFIRMNGIPSLPQVVGSNVCAIGFESTGDHLVVVSALDNLVKGGAGQAVQNANIMCGFKEEDGLTWPALGV